MNKLEREFKAEFLKLATIMIKKKKYKGINTLEIMGGCVLQLFLTDKNLKKIAVELSQWLKKP